MGQTDVFHPDVDFVLTMKVLIMFPTWTKCHIELHNFLYCVLFYCLLSKNEKPAGLRCGFCYMSCLVKGERHWIKVKMRTSKKLIIIIPLWFHESGFLFFKKSAGFHRSLQISADAATKNPQQQTWLSGLFIMKSWCFAISDSQWYEVIPSLNQNKNCSDQQLFMFSPWPAQAQNRVKRSSTDWKKESFYCSWQIYSMWTQIEPSLMGPIGSCQRIWQTCTTCRSVSRSLH